MPFYPAIESLVKSNLRARVISDNHLPKWFSAIVLRFFKKKFFFSL